MAGCLAVSACVAGCTAESDSRSGGGTGATASPSAACAWRTRADKQTLNIAYPDTAATYWGITFALARGERLELAGRYPAARYASFVSYGPNGGAIDVLNDRDIQPPPGSANPFSSTDARPGGSYTITIDPAGTGANVLSPVPTDGPTGSAATDGSTTPPDTTAGAIDRMVLGRGGTGATGGTVLYRVYRPNNPNDPTGGAGLPEVTLVSSDGARTPIRTCENPGASQAAIDLVNSFERPATATPPTPIFIRPRPNAINLYPNPDNVYVATITAHQPGRLVVVRGRAPTFPDTRAGERVGGGEQVRYWSMCTNEMRKPYPVSFCAIDDEVTLDDTGSFTFVFSTPADRPAAMPATAGSTWVEWGSTDVDMLLLMRHMLADPSFAESANGVTPGSLATSSMGDYAPRGAYCDKAIFEAGGYQACGL